MNIIIAGTTYNTNTINGLAKRISSASADLQRFANAAAAQAVLNRNLNWLQSLANACKLSSGKLSKSGRLAVSYIQHHCKGVGFDSKAGKFTLAKPEKTGFRDGAVLADGQTFTLTLADFEALEKPAAEPQAPQALQASALLKTLQAQLDKSEPGIAFADKGQARDTIAMLYKLAEIVAKQAADAPDVVDTVDAAMVAKSAAVAPSAKAKAAPKKAPKVA